MYRLTAHAGQQLTRHIHPQAKRQQQGMTLMEVIVVLGILGAVASGMGFFASRVTDYRLISETVHNVNAIRTAATQAWSETGYPWVNNVDTKYNGINDSNFATTQTAMLDVPLNALGLTGKLSAREAKNPISGKYIMVQGMAINAPPGYSSGMLLPGFFLVLNNLSQRQCRKLLLKLGNDWDYVSTDAGSGSKNTDYSYAFRFGDNIPVMTRDALSPDSSGAFPGHTGVLRTPRQANHLTANNTSQMCEASEINYIVLGSL